MDKFRNLTSDLNKLNEENPAMTTGEYVKENTVKHPYSQVIGLHTKDAQSNNEIFTISNFRDLYRSLYQIICKLSPLK